MRKLGLIFLFVNLLCILSFAQTADSFKPFAPVDEEFTIETLRLFPYALNCGAEKNVSKAYSRFFNGTYYYIFSIKKGTSDLPELLNKLAADNKAEKESVSLNQNKATKFRFFDKEGFHQTILISETEKRFYIFHTITDIDNNPDIKRFFSSIKLNGKGFETDTDFSDIKSSPTEIEDNKLTGNVNNSLVTAPSKNGIGFITDTKNSETSTIKLLAKPMALYTDLARIYLIEGAIALRVTFLANSEIGNVTEITDTSKPRLPLGLTKNAISAARRIKFEPQIINGVPQTISRTVIYHFNLL